MMVGSLSSNERFFFKQEKAESEVGCGYSSGCCFAIFDYSSFDYIVEDNAQKIYQVPIPALEKGKASQNGNIKSLETPLLEMGRRASHQRMDFSECDYCVGFQTLPSMCCGKRKRTLLLPEQEQHESVISYNLLGSSALFRKC